MPKGGKMSLKETIRDKVNDLMKYISETFYINDRNLYFGEKEYNDLVLLQTATSLLGGNILIRGNYGMGKTTTSEALSSLIYHHPIDFVSMTMIRGNPELTREEIYGTLSIPKFTKEGIEEVMWSLFTKVKSNKIVDEFNRIPEPKQILLLDSIGRGNFVYRFQQYSENKKYPFFATHNYKDGGNTNINLAILDRFDVSVGATPSVYYEEILGLYDESSLRKDVRDKLHELRIKREKELENAKTIEEIEIIDAKYREEWMNIIGRYLSDERRKELENPEISHDMFKVYTSSNNPKEIEERIKPLREAYREILRKQDIPVLSEEDKLLISKYTDKLSIPLTRDAHNYLLSFLLEVNAANKTPHTNISDRFKFSPVYAIKNNISPRIKKFADYCRFAAFVSGKDQVDKEIVNKLLPYAISHKIIPHKDVINEFKEEYEEISRKDPDTELAKHIVNEFDEYYERNKEKFVKIIDIALRGKDLELDTDLPSYMSIFQK